MRRIVTAAGFVAVCLWGLTSAALADNCQSKLLNTAYSCTFRCSGNGGPTEECISFGNFGHSSFFDIFNSEDDEGGCTCTDTGTTKDPKFNSSSSAFECSLNDFSGGYVGKISGKHLNGQSFYEDGDSCIFNCTRMGTTCP